MMIQGVGLDIVEIERIENALKRNKRFVTRILTQNERDIYESLTSDKRKLEFLSGRFAAKEAVAKAIGSGIGKLSFQHIEVGRADSGAPLVTVSGREGETFFLTITHTKGIAAAHAIHWGEN